LFFYGLSLLIYLPPSRRGGLLAATPLLCGLALAQVAGTLLRRTQRPRITAG
jgi:hypothetical protein